MKQLLCMLLLVTLLLCACTTSEQAVPTDDSSAHMQTETESAGSQESVFDESQFYKEYWEMVNGILDASRPAEAYQFPDLSGEITDVRVTVREREVDTYLLNGKRDIPVYDIFYGYLSNGEWCDFPSGNYELKPITVSSADTWEVCTLPHVTEIGSYILFAYPVGEGCYSSNLPEVTLSDTLNSEVLAFKDYYILQKGTGNDAEQNLHFLEDMRLYGTEEYRARLRPFAQWYFILLKKEMLTDDYQINVIENWEESWHDQQYIFTYDEIMGALGR